LIDYYSLLHVFDCHVYEMNDSKEITKQDP